jgi:hypothetical protein
MHVIPVEKAIEANSEAVSLEKLSYWLKKYDKYCLDICSCRRQQSMRGEGTGDIEDYWCIAVGDMAEFLVESHKDAYYATYDDRPENSKERADFYKAGWRTESQYSMNKKTLEGMLSLVKSEIDGLNNESQTDMTRLQSLVDRRDESYSTATDLMTSISDTRSNVIRNM